MKKVLLLFIFAIVCSRVHSQIPPDDGLHKVKMQTFMNFDNFFIRRSKLWRQQWSDNPLGGSKLWWWEIISRGVNVKAVGIDKPLFLFTFSASLMKGINELTDLVKNMQKEMTYQNAEIKHIQSLIENCPACQPPMDTCQYANPCFNGEW